ncbi:katanin p80 WD40 repeat-containing subunit B1 homolog isoform X4 [Durio zibethinus]|uniref:Katanin p80 WD40 repeat-containing subunit B1 homolog n=1 Tax=Durio zibethinus TaxID=66656 RepID=A0A6P5X822_DURZI|nr:katanin p80 WD40 repeat-containing subunit B1 homolog isoform X4 [Durio zibethinus]
MAKRGYKLQEFVAHTANVNCLSMGKKTCRLLITGGDDHTVNVWAIGKPTSLMSLCGHTSPVESLAFDSAEVLVLAGASTGVIKLWDLEETKMVRGLTGHRSNCTAMEFHPFGEFFASGSMDTNLKIWDIRKKGCIHTYKGHSRGISTIKFTPDGRWVVSGGFDNVVKVWDLTAGKLLNEFKFHEGHICSIDFHPLEFLLATGSADGTVKFWDLETFELIGSSRPEATGHSITFHPDGKTLFCGSDDGLRVYSWEPVVCHDSVDMGWSTLGDLCINEGKLLGCSYYRNSVGVWVADVAHVEPYGRNDHMEKKFNLEGSYSSEKAGSGMRSTLGSRSLSPDYETKEIKNIYIDSNESLNCNKDSNLVKFVNGVAVVPGRTRTLVERFERRERLNSSGDPATNITPPAVPETDKTPALMKVETQISKIQPISYNDANSAGSQISRKESASGCEGGIIGSQIPRRESTPTSDGIITGDQISRRELTLTPDRMIAGNQNSRKESTFAPDRLITGDQNSRKESTFTPHSIITVNQISRKESSSASSGIVTGNQISRREPTSASDGIITGNQITRSESTSISDRIISRNQFSRREATSANDKSGPNGTITENQISERGLSSADDGNVTIIERQISKGESISANDGNITESLMQMHDIFLSTLRSRLTKLQVVRHFWEKNDIKDAISALRKLPDHSVQADIISVLMEKIEILTLDLFSALLPVLMGLLDSKMERHVNVSLEMLLKVVAVFGPMIHSTVSAPRGVSVDLHAEQRRECCKICFMQLQKIQKLLPPLVRRGGVIARCAQELNQVLQQ